MENLRPQEVSIIIPCYNQGEYLHEAIISSLSQTIQPLEVIVVNDGSTDNTSEVARKYPVKLIEQNNRGLSAARNIGVSYTKGTHITCLDADDKLHSEYIEKLCGLSDISSSHVKYFGNEDGAWMPQNLKPTIGLMRKALQIHSATMFKREIWESIGGFDENMKEGYEDWDFWLRAMDKGYKIEIIPEFLIFYRKRAGSMLTETKKKHTKVYAYLKEKNGF